MKQFLRHIFLLLALFMATASAWAECYLYENKSITIEYDDNNHNDSGTFSSTEYSLVDDNGVFIGGTMTFKYDLSGGTNATNWHKLTIQGYTGSTWQDIWDTGKISNKDSETANIGDISSWKSYSKIRFKRTAKKESWTDWGKGERDINVTSLYITRLTSISPESASHTFDPITVGESTPTYDFTFDYSNVGTNFVVSSKKSSSHFSIEYIGDAPNACEGSAKYRVTYNPQFGGSHDEIYTITCKDGDAVKGTVTISVTGSAKGYPQHTWYGKDSYNVDDAAIDLDDIWDSNNEDFNTITYSIPETDGFVPSGTNNEGAVKPYIDADNKLYLGQAGTLHLVMHQIATDGFYEKTSTKTITINKYDVEASISQSTAVWNEIIDNPFSLSYGLIDFDVESRNTNIAEYHKDTKKIQTYFTDGIASFQITRPEDYKFNALDQTLTLEVRSDTEKCYLISGQSVTVNHETGKNSSGVYSSDFSLNGVGGVLTFKYKLNNDADVEHYITPQYSTTDNESNFTDIPNSKITTKSDSEQQSGEIIIPEGTKRIRFKRTAETIGTKNFSLSNITITRKQFLEPQIDDEAFYLTQSSVGMNFFGAFQLDWSTCADEIQLSCDNDLFTISTSATEEITTIDASAGEGSTMVYISYTTTEEDPDLTGTLTIYDHGQSKAITLSCEHMAQIIEWPEYFHRLEATENGYIDTLISLTAWAKTVKGLPTNQPITYTISVDTTEHASLINQDGSTYLHITGICTGIITASVEGFVSGNGITYSAASLTRPIRIRKAGDPCDPYALNIFDEVAFSGWVEDILIYELRGDLHESKMDFYAHVAERSIYNTLIIDFSTDGTTWTNRQTFENIPEAYDWTKHPQFQCTVPDDAKYVRFETKSSLNTYINMVTIRQQEYFNASVETIIINDAVVNELFTTSFQLDYSNVPFVQYSVTNHNGLNLQLLPSPEINNDCGDAGSYTFTLKGTSPYPQTNVTDTITLFTSAKHEIKIPVTITSTLTENIYYFVTAGDWSNLNNWRVNNIVPTQLPTSADPVVVQAADTISAHAHAYGISVQNGGSIHITPTGGLTIYAGGYASENQDEDLEISIDNNAAGYFRMSPDATTPMPRAKVNFTTRGNMNNGGNKDAAWQYIGAPGRDVGMDLLGTTVLYLRSEEKGWVRLRTFWAELQEFAGYALSQKEQPSFTLYPQLLKDDVTIPLTYTENGMQGDNLWANSYMAPLDITKFTEDDFTGNITRTFYLYNSGSWNNWNDQQSSSVTIDAADKTPGRYYAIAALSAANLGTETQTVISPMQGVYMVAGEGGGSIKLNYEKHVWNNIQTDEMNRPLRVAPISSHQPDIMRIRLQVNSLNSGADRMYIIQDSLTTSGYDNGYDAPKLMAEGLMNIYTNEPFGKMEISSTNDMDSMYIGFQAGEDTIYTMTFTSLLGDSLYLYDTEQDILLEMTEGGQYHFSAIPQSTNDFRFQLLVASESSEDNPEQGGDITTDVEAITPAKLWISDRQVYITNAKPNNSMAVYTISGMQIAAYTIHSAPCTIDLSYLPTGIYVLRLNNQAYKFICK